MTSLFWLAIIFVGLSYMTDATNVLKKFQQEFYQKNGKKLISFNSSKLLEDVVSTAQLFFHLGNPCLQGFQNLKRDNLFQYIDSFGKLGAGVENGNTLLLGSYSECTSLPKFHFCTLSDILLFQKLSLTLGVCMPETCTSSELVNFLKVIANLTNALNSTAFTISTQGMQDQLFGISDICYKNGKPELSYGAQVMIVISVILISLCLIGTTADIILNFLMKNMPKNQYNLISTKVDKSNVGDAELAKQFRTDDDVQVKAIVKFFLCFSMVKNARTLFDTSVPDNSIKSINGIRVISITWVMLGHSLLFGTFYYDDILIASSWSNQFLFQAIDNAMVSVDTFFLLSSLLVAYLSMKRYKTAGNLRLTHFYLHRYIRLTPPYLYATFFYAYLFPLLSEGPLWYTQSENSIPIISCVKYWWTNLLYINNFYPEQADMCMNWSWYLSNDMQFYVISPIILYVMHRFQLRGTLIINGILIVLCMIANGLLIDHYDGNPLISSLFLSLGSSESMPGYLSYTKNIYMKSYARIVSYAVGLVVGFFIFKEYNIFKKNKYLKNTVGWAVSVALSLAVVYGPYSSTKYTWGKVEIISYGVTFRFAWCLAVAWVIYACHNGYGGYVNDFLSWRAFVPLSRLSYSTYLVHPFIIYLFFASSQVAVHITLLSYAYYFVATVVLSFTVAVIFVLTIEYPVFNLEKLVF